MTHARTRTHTHAHARTPTHTRWFTFSATPHVAYIELIADAASLRPAQRPAAAELLQTIFAPRPAQWPPPRTNRAQPPRRRGMKRRHCRSSSTRAPFSAAAALGLPVVVAIGPAGGQILFEVVGATFLGLRGGTVQTKFYFWISMPMRAGVAYPTACPAARARCPAPRPAPGATVGARRHGKQRLAAAVCCARRKWGELHLASDRYVF